jgi:hypothetical protein
MSKNEVFSSTRADHNSGLHVTSNEEYGFYDICIYQPGGKVTLSVSQPGDVDVLDWLAHQLAQIAYTIKHKSRRDADPY